MAPAPLYAHARSNRWRLIRLLSTVALMPCAIASAYAQMAAPAAGGTGQTGAGETRTMNGTTTPAATAGGGGGGGVGAGVGGPGGRLSGFRLTMTGELTETYTTNSLGIPTAAVAGYSGGDFITTATVGFDLHDHTPRLDADIAYSLAGSHYANHPSFDRLSNYLTALAKADLIRNRLSFTGSAFAAPILVNGLGPQAGSASNSGLRDTYGYTISPDMMFRFGQFARSDTIITNSGVFFVEPNGATINQTIPGAPAVPNEVISYGATERISSGGDFFRLNWAWTTGVNKTTQSSVDLTSASSTVNLQYAFTRAVIGSAMAGYQSLTSNQVLSESLKSPTGSAGLTYHPNNDFQLNAYAGWAFNSPSYTGDLHYQVGAFTSFAANVTDTVTTPGQRLIGNLANLGINGAGSFINTGLLGNPGAPPTNAGVVGFDPTLLDSLAIASSIVRYRSESGSLVYIADRTQYRFTGFHTAFDTLSQLAVGLSPKGESTGIDLTISHSLTPKLTGSIGGDAAAVNDLGGNYKSYQINLSVNYAMTPVMQTYFSATYSHRSSDANLAASSVLSGDYSAGLVTIGIRRQFY